MLWQMSSLVLFVVLFVVEAAGQLSCNPYNLVDNSNDSLAVLSLAECTNVSMSLTLRNTTGLTLYISNSTVSNVRLSGNRNLTLVLTGIHVSIADGNFIDLDGFESQLVLLIDSSTITVSSGMVISAASSSTLASATVLLSNSRFFTNATDAFRFIRVTKGSNISMQLCDITNNFPQGSSSVAAGIRALNVSAASSFALMSTTVAVNLNMSGWFSVTSYGLYFPLWGGGGQLTVDNTTIAVSSQCLQAQGNIGDYHYLIYGSWNNATVVVTRSTLRSNSTFVGYYYYYTSGLVSNAYFISGPISLSNMTVEGNVMEVARGYQGVYYSSSSFVIFQATCTQSNVSLRRNLATVKDLYGQAAFLGATLNGPVGSVLVEGNWLDVQTKQLFFVGGSLSATNAAMIVRVINNTVLKNTVGTIYTLFAPSTNFGAAVVPLIVVNNVFTNQAGFAPFTLETCDNISLSMQQSSFVIVCGNRHFSSASSTILLVGSSVVLGTMGEVRDNIVNFTAQQFLKLTWTAATMNGGVVRNNTFVATAVNEVNYSPFSPEGAASSQPCLISGNVIKAYSTAIRPANLSVEFPPLCAVGVHICNNTATVGGVATINVVWLSGTMSVGSVVLDQNFGYFYGITNMGVVWYSRQSCTSSSGSVFVSNNYVLLLDVASGAAYLLRGETSLCYSATRNVTIINNSMRAENVQRLDFYYAMGISTSTYFLMTQNHVDVINVRDLFTTLAGYWLTDSNVTVRNNQILVYQNLITPSPPTLDRAASCAMSSYGEGLQCNNTMIAIGVVSHKHVWCSWCRVNGPGTLLVYANKVVAIEALTVSHTVMQSSALNSPGGTLALFNNEMLVTSSRAMSSVSATLLDNVGVNANNTLTVTRNYLSVDPDAASPSQVDVILAHLLYLNLGPTGAHLASLSQAVNSSCSQTLPFGCQQKWQIL